MFHIDASECLRNLATIERRVLDAARLGMDQVVKVAYRSAKETTLYKDQTGELRGTTDIVDLGAYKKRLILRASYARYINDGTKPHTILPKTPGGLLRFVIGGRVVFARKVRHPGTAKRPVLENAGAAGSQAARIILDEATERAVDYP
jgi:hypothetical protein